MTLLDRTRLRRAALLGPFVTTLLSVSACTLEEPLDDGFRSSVESPGILACHDDTPNEPGDLAGLAGEVFDLSWPEFQQQHPELQAATPEQVDAARESLIVAIEVLDADLLARAPGGGCVVDCESDARPPDEVDADGDVCHEDTERSEEGEASTANYVSDIWNMLPNSDACNALRMAALALDEFRGAIAEMADNCIGCTADDFDRLADLDDAAWDKQQEIAKKAKELGCSPPAGWVSW